MNVDFITAVKMFFANYTNFKGRSTRAEYWWVTLFLIVASGVIGFLSSLLGLGPVASKVVSGIWGLFTLVPGLSLAWRRLHDVDKAGGWYFINFIPVIGNIYFLILMVTPSKPDNRFGLCPYPDEVA